ncbi:MAG: peptide/nickel transport system permease protein, partial [Bradyrhizobium sp.]|nr:peptide/nickel transport system permease protein [Bradyrhizobium sp.]
MSGDVMAQILPRRRRLPAFRHLATSLGVLIVATALLVAIFAPYLTPHDPFAQDLNLRLIPPVWMEGGQPAHLLGTDQIGRDYLSRLIYGTRISMMIGILTVITSGLIGITLGIVGGFYGGRTDDVVMF